MVTPMPRAHTANPIVNEPAARRVSAAMPTAPEKRTGAWLVVLVYVVAAAALAYAVWERFLR